MIQMSPILAGVQRTDGIEFGVTGLYHARLVCLCIVCLSRRDYCQINTIQNGILIEGQSPANVSPNSGAVWTSYYLTDALEVGGGVFFRIVNSSRIHTLPRSLASLVLMAWRRTTMNTLMCS